MAPNDSLVTRPEIALLLLLAFCLVGIRNPSDVNNLQSQGWLEFVWILLSKGILSKKTTEVWSIRKSDTNHKGLVKLVEHYKNCDRGISCPLVDPDFQKLPAYNCLDILNDELLSISTEMIEESEILGKCGFGSMKSACFKAAPDTKLAIVFLKTNPKERKRDLIEREIELMQNLNHENVIRFIG